MSQACCIAILTDFGLTDAYVGIMKGVIAGICPGAQVIDINHDIPAQDVREGAWQLLAAYQYFPAGTVFLGVVDPRVGTERRALGLRAGSYTFIGPDNGLLSWAVAAAADGGTPTAHLLENAAYRRRDVSATFHGRDVFAPAAAHCAAGVDLADFGAPVQEWVTLPFPEPRTSDHGVLVGEVIHVDSFGNLITNISTATLDGLGAGAARGAFVVQCRGAHIESISETYASQRDGAVVALIGSTGHLEVAINGGSAHRRFQAGVGESITVYVK